MSLSKTQVTKSTSSVRTGFQCPGALPTAAEDATPTPPSTPPTPLNGVPTLPISPFTPIPPAILRIKENNKRKITPPPTPDQEVIFVKVEKRSPYFSHRQDCSSYLKKDLTYCDCRKPTKCDNCVKRGCDTECDCSVCGDTPQTPPFIKQEKKSSPPPAPKKQRTQGKLLLLVHHEKKPLTLVYRNNAFSYQPRR